MNQSVTKAGFFPRLAAYLADTCIVATVILCLKVPVLFLELAFADTFLFENVLFHFNIFDIIFYLLTVLYFVLFTSLTGTTIGKRLFNLAVVDEEGKKLTFLNALYRETVGKYLSAVFYFGYIMIFIDKENRAFHDYLCDSAVIYTCKFRVQRTTVAVPQPVLQTSGCGENFVGLYKESNTTPQSTIEPENIIYQSKENKITKE